MTPSARNRCLSRFKTGEAVGAVQCKRSHGHRGMHKAAAPWGQVDWAEKTAPVLSDTMRAGLIALHRDEHVYTKTLAALARRGLAIYTPGNGGYLKCPAGEALVASWTCASCGHLAYHCIASGCNHVNGDGDFCDCESFIAPAESPHVGEVRPRGGE